MPAFPAKFADDLLHTINNKNWGLLAEIIRQEIDSENVNFTFENSEQLVDEELRPANLLYFVISTAAPLYVIEEVLGKITDQSLSADRWSTVAFSEFLQNLYEHISHHPVTPPYTKKIQDILELFIRKGVNINQVDNLGYTAIFFLSIMIDSTDNEDNKSFLRNLTKILLESGAAATVNTVVTDPQIYGRTAFWNAGAALKDWKLVELMLPYVADVNITPPVGNQDHGITVLDLAIRHQNWIIAKKLCLKGADIEAALTRFVDPTIVRTYLAQSLARLEAMFNGPIIPAVVMDEKFQCSIAYTTVKDPVRLVVLDEVGNKVTEQQVYDRLTVDRIAQANNLSPFTRRAIIEVVNARDVSNSMSSSLQLEALRAAERLEKRDEPVAKRTRSASKPFLTPPPSPSKPKTSHPPETPRPSHRKRGPA